jgi:A/G-specific adenine glycosylase
MLQQTRVEAVKGYYQRFLQALPTIQHLAKADDEKLAKLWEGLGYYSRMRNLKKAAIVICETYGGEFPREYEDVLSLPGIGEYTAGAVCSIAFNQKTPAVDGNVLRLYSRLMNDPTPIDQPTMKKKTAEALRNVYPDRAGDFTQALMELGATICGPNRKQDCENCPCKGFCLGYQKGTAETLPVKAPKKERRQENMTVFILKCGDRYAIEKRPSKGLLAGLWQFPNVPGHLEPEEAVSTLSTWNIAVQDILRQTEKTHIFTHVEWNMRGYYLRVKAPAGSYVWMDRQTVTAQAALPTAFRIFFE